MNKKQLDKINASVGAVMTTAELYSRGNKEIFNAFIEGATYQMGIIIKELEKRYDKSND